MTSLANPQKTYSEEKINLALGNFSMPKVSDLFTVAEIKVSSKHKSLP
jgi:hypothetical protein